MFGKKQAREQAARREAIRLAVDYYRARGDIDLTNISLIIAAAERFGDYIKTATMTEVTLTLLRDAVPNGTSTQARSA